MILRPIRQYLRIAAVLGVMAVVGFLGTKLYQAGGAAERARVEQARQKVQNDLLEAGRKLRERAVQLDAETAALERRAREHEDEVSANPDNHCVLTDQRLHGLFERWGAP